MTKLPAFSINKNNNKLTYLKLICEKNKIP